MTGRRRPDPRDREIGHIPPYPTSSNEEIPYIRVSGSSISPDGRKQLDSLTSSRMHQSSSGEQVETDDTTGGHLGLGIRVVERPRSVERRARSPDSVVTERQPDPRSHRLQRHSREDTDGPDVQSTVRSTNRRLDPRYSEDRYDRRPTDRSGDFVRRKDQETEALVPISTISRSRRPSPMYDDRRAPRDQPYDDVEDDDRYGRSDRREEPRRVARGLSQVRDHRYELERDEPPRPRSPVRDRPDESDSGTSQQLVRRYPNSGRNVLGNDPDYDDGRGDGRAHGLLSPESGWRDSDEGRKSRHPEEASRNDDGRDRFRPRGKPQRLGHARERSRGCSDESVHQTPSYGSSPVSGREYDETEKCLRPGRVPKYGDGPDDKEFGTRESAESGKGREYGRDSRDEGRPVPRESRLRDSDTRDSGPRIGATSRTDDERRRLVPPGRNTRQVSTGSRYVEPGSWKEEDHDPRRLDSRRYDDLDQGERRGGNYLTSNTRSSREIPSRPRSPEPPKKTSGGYTTRTEVRERLDVYADSREERVRGASPLPPLAPAPPQLQLDVSSWEFELERRQRPRRRAPGGSEGDGRSGPRSTGSTDRTPRPERVVERDPIETVTVSRPTLSRHHTSPERDHLTDRSARMTDRPERPVEVVTVSRPAPSRDADRRETHAEYTGTIPRRRDTGKGPVEVSTTASLAPSGSSEILRSQVKVSQDRSPYTARENEILDAEGRKKKLDTWRSAAMSKVKECSDQLSVDLRSAFLREISGGRGAGKGWGEIYRWNSKDGASQFRGKRHAFVTAAKNEMEDMVKSTYELYAKSPSRGIPSSVLSVASGVTSTFDGKSGVYVTPTATITVGDWVLPSPKRNPVYFKRRSVWS